MITADAREFIARQHMTNALTERYRRHIQHLWDMIDNDYSPDVLDHTITEAERIEAELPTADHLDAWHELGARLASFHGLGHEDREYLALVHADYHRALDAVERAAFGEAVAAFDDAHKRLRWMSYERRREGSRTTMWLPPEQKRRLRDLCAELEAIAPVLQRARRVAS